MYNMSESDLRSALEQHDELNTWWRSLTLHQKSWVRSRWGVLGKMAYNQHTIEETAAEPENIVEALEEQVAQPEPVIYPNVLPMEAGIGIKEKPHGRKKAE